MSYLLHIFILGSVIWLIGRKQPDRVIFFTGILTKLTAGICLGLIFQYHYWGGDTFEYYESANMLAEGSFTDWLQNISKPEIGGFHNQPRAILFTKIVSGFILFTRGDYWIVTCYFSFLSFMAFWFLYRQIRTTLPNVIIPFSIGFLYLPSSVFWSSGIIKETLTTAALVYICAFGLKLFYRKKIHIPEIVLTTLSFIILYYIKYYILIILVPVVLYALFDRKAFRAGIRPGIRGIVYAVIVFGTLLVAPFINPNLHVLRLPESIHKNQEVAFQPTPQDSSIDLRIEPTWKSLLQSAPHALLVGLYGPSIFDRGSIWSWVPKLENSLLIILTLLSLVLLIHQKLYKPDILVVAMILLILSLAIMLPLAAPNFGALVRYKAPFTPFLFTLVSILPYWYYQKRWQNQ